MKLALTAKAVLLLTLFIGATAQAKKPVTPPMEPAVAPHVFVDATGKTVGIAMSNRVTLTLEGRPIRLFLERPKPLVDGYYDHSLNTWYTGRRVLFESTDCSGAPLMEASDDDGPYPFGTAVQKGQGAGAYTLFVSDLSKIRPITPSSYLSDGACYASTSPYTALVAPVVATHDLGAMFTLPLRVQ